jgi:hypothetical protein
VRKSKEKGRNTEIRLNSQSKSTTSPCHPLLDSALLINAFGHGINVLTALLHCTHKKCRKAGGGDRNEAEMGMDMENGETKDNSETHSKIFSEEIKKEN